MVHLSNFWTDLYSNEGRPLKHPTICSKQRVISATDNSLGTLTENYERTTCRSVKVVIHSFDTNLDASNIKKLLEDH